NVTEIPIVGRVSAGNPILAEENIEGTIFVDKFLARNNIGMFILRVKGTSMINAGIFNGDFILVRQQSTVDQGEMVIALIEGEATVKRFYKDGDKIKLIPENEKMEPIIIYSKKTNIRILGKVEGVIRKV
ncbi:MAG: repressor LexA, partial [Actinobacteria bacterium]|nr:repressor LexA [Actinomycetota bacterium]